MLLGGQLPSSTFSAKGTFENCYNGEIGLHMNSNFNRLYLPVDKKGQTQLLPPRSHFANILGFYGESVGVRGIF